MVCSRYQITAKENMHLDATEASQDKKEES
jgi:hypothetical protein